MEEKNKELKILLRNIDQEFYGLDPIMQAKFAIEQINMWQQKFNEAKQKVPMANIVHATRGSKIIDQYAEIEA